MYVLYLSYDVKQSKQQLWNVTKKEQKQV